MYDQDKTKEELISELVGMRQRIAKLEGSLVTYKQQQEATRPLGMTTDITDLEKSKEEIKRQRDFLQQLIDTIPTPIFYKDREGRYLGCNTAFEADTGKSRAEIVGKTVFDVAPSDLAEIYFEEDLSLLRNPGVQQGENRRKDAAGNVHDVVFSKGTFLDREGNVAGIVGVVLDITDRKRAEEALRESEEQYRAVFDNAGIGIDLLDPEGRIVKVNKALLNILGYAEEELRQLTFLDITHPDDREISKRNLEALTAREIDSYRLEKRYVRKDGTIVWGDLWTCGIRDATGEHAGTVGVIADITERKKAEDGLRASQARYRAVVESQTELICRYLPNGTITFANGPYCRYFGKTPEGLIGQNLTQRVPEEDRESVARHFASLSGENPILTHEHRVIRPDGEIRWQRWTDRAIFDDHGNLIEIQGVGQDITNQKKAEESLQEAQRDLSIRQRLSEVFLSASDDALYERVLLVVQDVLRSPLGLFGYVDEDGAMVCPSLTKTALEAYQVSGKSIVFPRETWGGIWGKAFTEKVCLYSNEGLRVPEGHVAIDSHIVLPIVYQGELIGTLQLSNKEGGYNEKDKDLLTGIGDWLAPILHARLRRERERKRRRHAEEALAKLNENLEEQVRFRTHALRESEERFRKVFEQGTLGIAIVGLDYQWVAVNEALCEMVGYTEDELTRLTFVDITHPDDIEEDVANAEKLFRGEIPYYEMEKRCIRKSGEIIWIHLTGSIVRDDQGKALYYLAMIENITRRKRAENIMLARFRLVEYSASHSLEELLQATLDEVEALTDSAIGFYHFVEADQRTLRLQAWSTRTLREMCTAEGKGLHYNIDEAGVWVDCVHKRRPVIHNDYSALPHRKGMPVGHANVIRELVVPVLRGDRIVAILGVGNKPENYDASDIETVSLLADLAWDIAERKQAEEALRESQERLELALEGAELGMWDWNIQTGELVFNRRWAEMVGYSPDEIRPHIDSWEDSIHPEDAERVKGVLNRHVAGETPSYETEYRIATKSGEVRWVLARGKVVERDADGRPLRATETRVDITDRKRAEELVRERTEALERSNQDLEQFAYVAAHDLREPLVAVGAYLKLLERRCAKNLDVDAHKFLARAIETTLRMDAVIQSLLAYSRIGSDDRSLEPTDCQAVLKNALSNLHSAIKENGATVTSDALPTVMADASQLLQLFQNLLSNAIKFRGDEPLKIHVGCAQGTGEFQFSVKDNGIGVEPPYFERIFRIFQRIRSGSDRPGTGIGLANCKKIVESHGGRIWVESAPGKGSTFFFTLPDRPKKS
jgi:PAS domain S-box-containing protein